MKFMFGKPSTCVKDKGTTTMGVGFILLILTLIQVLVLINKGVGASFLMVLINLGVVSSFQLVLINLNILFIYIPWFSHTLGFHVKMYMPCIFILFSLYLWMHLQNFEDKKLVHIHPLLVLLNIPKIGISSGSFINNFTTIRYILVRTMDNKEEYTKYGHPLFDGQTYSFWSIRIKFFLHT